jgi:hypothetical protein
MNELETNFFVGLSWHFGGGKPYMSGTAGVGVSRKFDAIQPGVNLAVNFYNGGIGAREDSNMMHYDTVLTGKITAGGGKGNPMTVYPLHLDSGTGLVDNYKYSATLGANLILNNSNRNQKVGFLQLRAGDFSFQTYNDFGGFKKIGIADGYDRWWTGGGNVTVGARNSEYQLIIASDVFTADTDSDNEVDRANSHRSLEEFNKQNTGSGFQKLKNKLSSYTPTTASEVDQTFLNASRDGAQWTPEKHSFNLNQGRTSFRLKTPQGQFGLNSLGKSNMYSQDIIHRVINFHLIPSERKDYWEFQYSPTINTGF